MSARVVVLGTGFAGLTVARALARRRGAPRIALTAVNRENYALFTPMLPEVASGAIEPRHVAEPFRTSVPRATFVLGEVEGVDFDRRTVAARHPVTGEVSDIAYDQLVIALGAVSTTHGVPGADAHTLPLKTLDDAVRMRAQLIRALEAATVAEAGERSALLTVAVIGGGFTGVEAAAPRDRGERRSVGARPAQRVGPGRLRAHPQAGRRRVPADRAARGARSGSARAQRRRGAARSRDTPDALPVAGDDGIARRPRRSRRHRRPRAHRRPARVAPVARVLSGAPARRVPQDARRAGLVARASFPPDIVSIGSTT